MCSLIFNPDPRQALETYDNLLKLAEQERLANQAMKTQKTVLSKFRGLTLLRRLLAGRKSRKLIQTTSQPSNAGS